MSAEQLLVNFNYDQFLWKECSDGLFDKGGQTIFLAVHLRLAVTKSEEAVREAASHVWIALRHQIPVIAASLELDGSDTPLLTYRVLEEQQVSEWAARTLVVHTQPSLDLNALREELGAQKVPSPSGDYTHMHVVLPSSSGAIDQLGFLLHVHHSLLDGNGAKASMHAFLTQFAKQIDSSGAGDVQFRWGEEAERLTPALWSVLHPSEPLLIKPDSSEEPSFSHAMYAALGEEMQRAGRFTQNAYGFRPREGDKSPWPAYRHTDLVFSEEESEKLLRSMKSQPYTMTVLAHAALVMVTMFFNPASSQFAEHTLNNWTIIDVRHRLAEPFCSRHGFAGYAISPASLFLPVSLFLASDGTLLPLDRETLFKAVEDLGERYRSQKAVHPGYMPLAADLFSRGLKQGYAAGLVPPNQCYSWVSDGKGEDRFDSTYNDEKGSPAFDLTRFFTSINQPDPAPSFRLSSWRGVFEISADFNENVISREEVKEYLVKWKEFMVLVMQ
ncbi:hypothetical protein FB45DRAFT_1092915 [Roridomyces roridus]|uniref:Condensation domain-containing protein n=1 Tax=Roridomyces roridus TaxID=1738132 RepID=A0AAD7BHR9_9AGAR|nr:hypothetical protein FB45DRAFT_1092915 [Roridomyces roridus]